jgi:hypothetical protein
MEKTRTGKMALVHVSGALGGHCTSTLRPSFSLAIAAAQSWVRCFRCAADPSPIRDEQGCAKPSADGETCASVADPLTDEDDEGCVVAADACATLAEPGAHAAC